MTSDSPPRRFYLALLVAAIACASFQPFYLRIFSMDRAAFGRSVADIPYRRFPRLRTFLTEAEQALPRGSRVALVGPCSDWNCYDYLYMRAMFVCDDVQIIRTIERDGSPARLTEIDGVISYGVAQVPPGFTIVW